MEIDLVATLDAGDGFGWANEVHVASLAERDAPGPGSESPG